MLRRRWWFDEVAANHGEPNESKAQKGQKGTLMIPETRHIRLRSRCVVLRQTKKQNNASIQRLFEGKAAVVDVSAKLEHRPVPKPKKAAATKRLKGKASANDASRSFKERYDQHRQGQNLPRDQNKLEALSPRDQNLPRQTVPATGNSNPKDAGMHHPDAIMNGVINLSFDEWGDAGIKVGYYHISARLVQEVGSGCLTPCVVLRCCPPAGRHLRLPKHQPESKTAVECQPEQPAPG